MFDIGFSKILVIFGLALVVLGPEKLPRVAATVGRWVGRARVMARQFRDQLEQESEGLRKGADSFREAADGLRKGSDSFREAADGLRREFDPNAVPVPGKVPTPAPSPVPMSATPATPAEAPANPEALATPDPGERPPRHSDIDELVRDPAAPTPATPPPPKHEPGT
ncbi:MAG: Sec-independent protein translocase protein TatB [Steroidobacteraceae bacterium]|jgi:sec-independent protein translocase protein TatB